MITIQILGTEKVVSNLLAMTPEILANFEKAIERGIRGK